MKRLLIALVMLTASTVYAVDFYNASNTKLGNLNQVKCDTGLTCTITSGKLLITPTSLVATGDVAGDGGDQFYGFLQNQVASTSASLTAAQCGSTVISNSADVIVLPEASTVLGCQYTFVCGTADDFDIDPADGTDVIGVINSVAGGTGAAITPSAGDEVRCTDIGSSLVLEATGANLWSAIGVANGAWTDVN
jgi:hypothetical protein